MRLIYYNMNTLEKLFGSAAKVKLFRLFLLSPDKVFAAAETTKVLKISKNSATKEIRFLLSVGFIKKAVRKDILTIKKGKKTKTKKIKVAGFMLSPTFPFTLALRSLLVTASPVSREKMLHFFKSRGKIKLVALGGIFSDDLTGGFPSDDSRLDLVVVGALKRAKVENFIKNLESEIGKELNWTLLSSLEFDHRMGMHDKLLRDLFDYPHEFLINKLALD